VSGHLAAAALAGALLTLQTSAGGAAGLLGVHADLLLVFVLGIGMRRGETAGALWGIGLGFVEDVFSAGLPGANILTTGLLGFAAGSLREQLDCENPNTQAIVAAVATLAQGLVHLALLEVFSAGRGVISPFLGTIAPAAAANGVLLPAADLLRRRYLRRRSRRPAAAGA
jgi:rod shape-determining protein MreD